MINFSPPSATIATLLITPTNSPRVGPNSDVSIPVGPVAANGYIQFAVESLAVEAEEPDSGLSPSS